MRIFLILAALALGLSETAFAETMRDPGSAAYGSSGSIRIDANWLSPSGCGRVVGSGQYAPPGIALRRDAVPLTIEVDMTLGRCDRPRLVRHMTNVSSFVTTPIISIFFVSTQGQILKRENVSPTPNYRVPLF